MALGINFSFLSSFFLVSKKHKIISPSPSQACGGIGNIVLAY